jgi:hypothetical protein
MTAADRQRSLEQKENWGHTRDAEVDPHRAALNPTRERDVNDEETQETRTRAEDGDVERAERRQPPYVHDLAIPKDSDDAEHPSTPTSPIIEAPGTLPLRPSTPRARLRRRRCAKERATAFERPYDDAEAASVPAAHDVCVGCAYSTGTCRGLFERGNARPGHVKFGCSETRIWPCCGVAQDGRTVRADAKQGSVSSRLAVNVLPGALALIIGESSCT